nr:zf-C3HC4 type zinc finger protein [Cryptococcus depauperatus CBS 7841]
MGNAPSAPQPAATEQRPTATSATPQPINTGGSTHLGSVAFHSGLTPPTLPPSPPPPTTPTLLPHAGHLSPQNPHCLSHPQAHDYSKSAATRLILDGKLAPFYRGLEDYEEDWTEEDIGRILDEIREKDYAEGVANSFTVRLKEEREGGPNLTKKIGMHKQKDSRKEEENVERERRERRAYKDAIECPICFLNYPPNINTSRCCQQPVCTECFVQIKRSEPTLTHIQSEPACCPFCVETDFGVIYERPLSPLSSLSGTALATSPDQGDSFPSQAFSVGSEAELAIGPGMNPTRKETLRRKSVSSKAKEVVTIDEIRPDWEAKLNAVKAAAARKASRRIIMRQIGDRLVPIGYTSSRAPGVADVSASTGQNDENGPNSRRSRRRESNNRERELEEVSAAFYRLVFSVDVNQLMIEEAMRLSLLDHEEHLRKQANERRRASSAASIPPNTTTPPPTFGGSNTTSPGPPPGPSTSAAFAATAVPSSQASSSRRPSGQLDKKDEKQSGTSKLFNKLNNVRTRTNSVGTKSLNIGGRARGNSTGGQNLVAPSSSAGLHTVHTSNPDSTSTSTASTAAPSPIPSYNLVTSNHPSQLKAVTNYAGSTGLSPSSPAPVAVSPVTTLANPGATGQHSRSDLNNAPTSDASPCSSSRKADNTSLGSAGLPRISVDMPALIPDSAGLTKTKVEQTAFSSSVTAQEEGKDKKLGPTPVGDDVQSSGPRMLYRAHSDISEITELEDSERSAEYARLDSGDER